MASASMAASARAATTPPAARSRAGGGRGAQTSSTSTSASASASASARLAARATIARRRASVGDDRNRNRNRDAVLVRASWDAEDGGGGGGGGGGWNGAAGAGTAARDDPDVRLKHFFPPVGVADDHTIANPLLRSQRLSTGWFGCVFELEGVLVNSREAEHREAWTKLAKERGERPPAELVLKYCDLMKPEAFIERQLRWTRDPMEVRRIRQRKGEIYDEILEEQKSLGGRGGGGGDGIGGGGGLDEFALRDGVLPFLNLLADAGVPMAAISNAYGYHDLCGVLSKIGILGYFEDANDGQGPHVVAADDVRDWLPDPEPLERACDLMQRTPKRTIVFGNNTTVTEACYEKGSKAVLLLGRQPRYEMQNADSVVEKLTDLTIANLKNLFADETSEAAEPERQVEIMPSKGSSVSTAVSSPDAWTQTQTDDAGGKEPPDYFKRRRRRDI